MSIKTPDNSLGEALAAILIMAYNPLTYRGYTFAPALSYNYYLGSRFYIPQLCRFMNADVYADTAQGVVGTNMFAYCNNNPISFVDPEGTNSNANTKNNEGAIHSIFSYFLTLIAMAYWLTTGVYLEPISISFSTAKTEVKTKEKTLTDTRARLPNKI